MTFSSPMVSRAVALGLLLVALAAIWSLLVEPLWARHQSALRSAEQSEALLLRYQRIAADRPALQDRLERVEEPRSDARRFLDGVSPDLVAAELQDRIKRAVESSGATLTSMRILAPEDQAGHRRVSLRVNLECETSALQELFHGIETAAPYLFLDNVDVRVRRKAGQRRGAPAAGSLRVRFDVHGYMRAAGT